MKDVVVIGGGVVGASIIRKLSYYNLDIALVEKQPDVCEGSSKANSGVVHTGFDAPPNSVEAEALKRSRELWPQLVKDLNIPFASRGAVMVATSKEEKEIIKNKYIPNAEANGVQVKWISREEILENNPDVTDNVIGGLLVEGESVCDPWVATRVHAELAAMNGAEVKLGSGVVHVEEVDDGLKLILEDDTKIVTKYVVNAAGLYSDEIARLIGDDSFTITPRKGQFILSEQHADISQIILPVPTPTSKGKLVTPIVYGGFLFGPTAEEQEDKTNTSTTEAGVEEVLKDCGKLVPKSQELDSIRQFAGLRAVCSTGDYVIRPSEENNRMIHAAGIRSTGLSAAPGIAEMVAEQLQSVGLELEEKEDALYKTPNPYENPEKLLSGEIVCMCRNIYRGQIENALNGPIPVTTLDGIKRRTGVTLGKCQGNDCVPKVLDIMEENGINTDEMMKDVQKSFLTVGRGNN